MKLIIVESQAKAKKIAGFLGSGWRVEACRGHVCDLPEAELGVDVQSDFRPTYEVLPGKGNLIKRLLKAIKDAEGIYVATDPDRDGEAMAWHLLKLATIPKDKPLYRAVFTAITKEAVQQAVIHPRALDVNLVEAQQARRIVDRLVGYLASPLAAKALDGKFSTGRLQSVCLRLIVEREREIEAFRPETYWTLSLRLAADGREFTVRLHRIKDMGTAFKARDPVNKLVTLLQTAQIWVGKAGRMVKPRNPLPPFTTASLQQAASKAFGLSPDKTMSLAQTLYEQGWITYIRTDGISVTPEAQTAVRDFVARAYGMDYVPHEPTTDSAQVATTQEAHEAIRPTDVNHLPEAVLGEGAALYDLIWRRFVASQMTPALYTVTGAVIYAGKVQGQPFPMEFRGQGRSLLFDGFLKVYAEPADEGETQEEWEDDEKLPLLTDNQPLKLVAPQVEEQRTRPPTRYTEAALVQALEERRIGRPSTYAFIMKTVKDKGYIRISQKRLTPTESGIRLSDFLAAHFADVLTVDSSARLEDQLDQIAAGDITRLDVLRAFWNGFQPQVTKAAAHAYEQTAVRHTPKPLLLHAAKE